MAKIYQKLMLNNNVGRITIPKGVVAYLNLKEGDILEVEIHKIMRVETNENEELQSDNSRNQSEAKGTRLSDY